MCYLPESSIATKKIYFFRGSTERWKNKIIYGLVQQQELLYQFLKEVHEKVFIKNIKQIIILLYIYYSN